MARILIVDDDEADRVLMRAILQNGNHEIFFAEDGVEALRILGARQIQVVITDLQMPRVHGLELISMIRDFEPRPAIIAISGTGSPQLEMANAIGAYWTVEKPVDAFALLDAVAEAAGSTG